MCLVVCSATSTSTLNSSEPIQLPLSVFNARIG